MQNPGSSETVRAMRSVPFKVCTEIFMTETAKECDLVLPAATYLEERHDWLGSYWHSFLVRSERIVEPQGMVKSDIEIYDGLAKTLGLKTNLIGLYEEMDRLMLSGKRLEKVSEGLYEWQEPIYWTDRGTMAKLPADIPALSVRENEELRLVTFHVKDYINGHSCDAPSIPDIPDIYLSPDDMEKISLEEGDMVTVYSRTGEHIVMRAKRDASLRKRPRFSKAGRARHKLSNRSTGSSRLRSPLCGHFCKDRKNHLASKQVTIQREKIISKRPSLFWSISYNLRLFQDSSLSLRARPDLLFYQAELIPC
jgi:Anaerobic dehydrogenases, typically selenocysteine-containing